MTTPSERIRFVIVFRVGAEFHQHTGTRSLQRGAHLFLGSCIGAKFAGGFHEHIDELIERQLSDHLIAMRDMQLWSCVFYPRIAECHAQERGLPSFQALDAHALEVFTEIIVVEQALIEQIEQVHESRFATQSIEQGTHCVSTSGGRIQAGSSLYFWKIFAVSPLAVTAMRPSTSACFSSSRPLATATPTLIPGRKLNPASSNGFSAEIAVAIIAFDSMMSTRAVSTICQAWERSWNVFNSRAGLPAATHLSLILCSITISTVARPARALVPHRSSSDCRFFGLPLWTMARSAMVEYRTKSTIFARSGV